MRYFYLTLRHKWFVLLAGIKLRVPIVRLLLHDLTKFLPSELPHYQRQFFGRADQPEKFIRCWIHHQNHNDHHWGYWIPRTGHNRCKPPYPDDEPVPMRDVAIREMVSDWMAAGRAYENRWPDLQRWTWLEKHLYGIMRGLHRDTARRLRDVLLEIDAWPQPCDYLTHRGGCSRSENVTGECRRGDCVFGCGMLWMHNDGLNLEV